MSHLITWALALALVYVFFRMAKQRRETRRLHLALQERQPLLNEDIPGDLGQSWEALCRAVNSTIEENAELQASRSGQLAQLQATLGSLQEAVLIVDRDNYILLANRALAAIFPSARDILKQRLESVLRSSSFLGYVDAVRRNSASPQQEVEFVEGHQSIYLEVTGTTIPSLNGGRGPWALFVLHDITKLKKLEMVRKDFVANVSHELRTPLSVIKGYIETLVDGHREMPLEQREKFLATIQRHTERLNSLLEDLLTLSRLESINPGLKRESVDLTALIKDVLADYGGRPAAADHRLEFSPDSVVERVLADPLKLSQVLENLIDNALKYTPKGSTIRLLLLQKENEVEVQVADTGMGIPEADLPHIFERFYRVDKGRSREKGGTGLGLSIVKHIVQLHGGRVWVESAIGKGTTFHFSLPLHIVESVG